MARARLHELIPLPKVVSYFDTFTHQSDKYMHVDTQQFWGIFPGLSKLDGLFKDLQQTAAAIQCTEQTSKPTVSRHQRQQTLTNRQTQLQLVG